MSATATKRLYDMTPEELRERGAKAREQIEADLPRLMHEALAHKAQLLAMEEALRELVKVRQAKGVSCAELARQSRIELADLERLETTPHPNVTMITLSQIAEALGVAIKIGIVDKAA